MLGVAVGMEKGHTQCHLPYRQLFQMYDKNFLCMHGFLLNLTPSDKHSSFYTNLFFFCSSMTGKVGFLGTLLQTNSLHHCEAREDEFGNVGESPGEIGSVC